MRCRLSLSPIRLLLLAGLLILGGCVGPQSRLQPADIAADSQPVSRDTTIALLGGTGMAGSHILREALERGYPLRVLSRSPEKLEYLRDRITVVAGDARDPAVIAELIKDSDVVISAIGPVASDSRGAIDLNTTVTGNLLQAMPVEGLRRYIVVTGAGVTMPGDQRNFTGWLVRQLARLRFPRLLEDRQAEYRLLADSALDWTLVRCPLIESAPFHQEPRVSLQSPASFGLRAGELADFIVDLVEAGGFEGQGPFLNSN